MEQKTEKQSLLESRVRTVAFAKKVIFLEERSCVSMAFGTSRTQYKVYVKPAALQHSEQNESEFIRWIPRNFFARNKSRQIFSARMSINVDFCVV